MHQSCDSLPVYNKDLDEWFLEYEDDLLRIKNKIRKTGSIEGISLDDIIDEGFCYD